MKYITCFILCLFLSVSFAAPNDDIVTIGSGPHVIKPMQMLIYKIPYKDPAVGKPVSCALYGNQSEAVNVKISTVGLRSAYTPPDETMEVSNGSVKYFRIKNVQPSFSYDSHIYFQSEASNLYYVTVNCLIV